jgi:hypothetical protein
MHTQAPRESDLAADIRNFLTTHQILLIIDNLDRIEALWAGEALHWIRQGLGLSKCLITSRAANTAERLTGAVCTQLTQDDNNTMMEPMLAQLASSSSARLVLDTDFQVRH